MDLQSSAEVLLGPSGSLHGLHAGAAQLIVQSGPDSACAQGYAQAFSFEKKAYHRRAK